MRDFSVIVAAVQHHRGIGFQNTIPWKLKPDMDEFKRITMETQDKKQNAVIMGRKTWESIPKKFRPLPGRFNIVLTKNIKYEAEEALVATSLAHAFTMLTSPIIDNIFVIGGSSSYQEALESTYCQYIYLTNIFTYYDCDVFFPPIDASKFELCATGDIQQCKDVKFQFVKYVKRHEEHQYLDLIASCIATGNDKEDRTGTGTLSHFGRMMRFSLREDTLPLFTTKDVFWRGVVEELLWFIAGCTDSKKLSNKRVKIWDANGSREFLNKLGFPDREVGDLGPVYSHQWRHFGADYVDCKTDYTGQGMDQLAQVIETIKTNPNDRRMLVCAWNPTDLPKMALPPCHVLFQFYVFDGKLSCLMMQRSCDLGLGVSFNVASYSLLTKMIAHVCDLEPCEFVHFLGDTHVYKNHVEPLKEQLLRTPRPFPKVKMNPNKKNIDDFVFEDFELIEYNPHPKIKMQMAV